ncbi:MAG: hypothetical protein ABI905_00705 [Betaproteobacteria bacterium]
MFYEHISKPVISRLQFISRLARALMMGLAMVVVSLLFGMGGYLYFFPTLDTADAFVNAAMILSGMGPLATPQTTGAKIFSGVYALYSGLMLVMSAGVVFAPLVHRFLHKFHADEDEANERADEAAQDAASKHKEKTAKARAKR